MSQSKNVVFILTDQLRKDCIGAYGNPYVHTPNLDRLAASSIQFDRSYVANPICCPNRMSIFTGRMPSNHGLWTNGLLGQHPEHTIPSYLKNFGYQTANIGKLHFNPYSKESKDFSLESEAAWPQIPEKESYTGGYFGFDYVELTIGHTLPKSHYYKWFLEHGGTDDMFDVELYGPAYTPDERCGVRKMPSTLSSSSFVGDRAVNYLRHVRNPNQPFFLSVSFPDPHHPFTSCFDDYETWRTRPVHQPIGDASDLATRPPHYERHFRGGWTRRGEVPCRYSEGVPEVIATERTRHTYAMIDNIDRNIGKVIDELETLDLLDDTIIVFASDHGELLGDHGLWLKGPFFYEGLINTPLLMRVPGYQQRICGQLISSVDLAPTIYDLLGLEIPLYIDGVSQVETLKNEEVVCRDSCVVEYRNGYHCDVNVNALVTKSYKFVQYENGEAEYTDLAVDPSESVNRANDPAWHCQVLDAARSLLIQQLKNKSKGAVQYGHA
ncbi:MAG: sulfatase [Lawsonibacter sp.]